MPGELHLVWVAWVDTRNYMQVDAAVAEVSGVTTLHGERLWCYGLETIGGRGVNRECREKWKGNFMQTYLLEDMQNPAHDPWGVVQECLPRKGTAEGKGVARGSETSVK